MEKLTLMGEHYVCEVHLSSHTLESSWECSSHGSGRVEGVPSLGKLAWPRASLAHAPASSVRSFLPSVQRHLAIYHVAHVSPRGKKLHHFVPFVASCAHRDSVFGFCSSPRKACPTNSKSTSRSRFRGVSRTANFFPSSSTSAAPSTSATRHTFTIASSSCMFATSYTPVRQGSVPADLT